MAKGLEIFEVPSSLTRPNLWFDDFALAVSNKMFCFICFGFQMCYFAISHRIIELF